MAQGRSNGGRPACHAAGRPGAAAPGRTLGAMAVLIDPPLRTAGRAHPFAMSDAAAIAPTITKSGPTMRKLTAATRMLCRE
jgi:hypothetical protein